MHLLVIEAQYVTHITIFLVEMVIMRLTTRPVTLISRLLIWLFSVFLFWCLVLNT